jgi:hypothetical protein
LSILSILAILKSFNNLGVLKTGLPEELFSSSTKLNSIANEIAQVYGKLAIQSMKNL